MNLPTTMMAQTMASRPMPLALPADFPAVLDADRLAKLAEQVEATDYAGMAAREIATLGAEAEQALHRSLDAFLGKVEKAEAPRLFKLVETLREAVDQEDLPTVAARILDAKPSLGERLIGLFNKSAFRRAAARAYEEACRVASGKSRRLSDLIAALERELEVEQGRLTAEIQNLESLKDAYRERFVQFAEVVAWMTGLLEKARCETRVLINATADSATIAEAEDKLQALESRALALEGILSRLPSDQLVIRQLQNAGITTLQELTTTTASRFASIKMALLAIHGARLTQDVQRLARQGAELDRNLTAVRGLLMRDVVATAADAPGNNRIAQAGQLRTIVAETASLQRVVDETRARNREKFEAARQTFAQARQDMVALGKALAPGQALSS